jgi:hypothetical protein
MYYFFSITLKPIPPAEMLMSPPSSGNRVVKSKLKPQSIKLHDLYYHTATTGSLNRTNESDDVPVQIAFPSGETGIALPLNKRSTLRRRQNNQNDRFNYVAVAAPRVDDSQDIVSRVRLTIVFLVVIIVNITITAMLYNDADISDSTKVEPLSSSKLPTAFSKVSHERRELSNYLFIFTLLTLLFGGVAAMFGSHFGLWLFQLVTTTNAVLSVYAYPNFVYGLRYIVDAMLVHIAMRLQEAWQINVVPVPTNHNFLQSG